MFLGFDNAVVVVVAVNIVVVDWFDANIFLLRVPHAWSVAGVCGYRRWFVWSKRSVSIIMEMK